MKNKKLIGIVVTLLLVMCSCNSHEETIRVSRKGSSGDNQYLFADAKRITLHYDQRKVVVSDIKSMGGDCFDKYGSPSVNKVKFDEEGNMTVLIPPDDHYEVWINEEHYSFPQITNKYQEISEIDRD